MTYRVPLVLSTRSCTVVSHQWEYILAGNEIMPLDYAFPSRWTHVAHYKKRIRTRWLTTHTQKSARWIWALLLFVSSVSKPTLTANVLSLIQASFKRPEPTSPAHCGQAGKFNIIWVQKIKLAESDQMNWRKRAFNTDGIIDLNSLSNDPALNYFSQFK